MSDEEKPKKPRSRTVKGQTTNMGRKKGTPATGGSIETRFGGPRGNPSGLSREQALARYEAGKLAERVQVAWLQDLVNKITAEPSKAIEHLNDTRLRLMTDALDRANGKAVAAVEVTSPDGSMSPPEAIRIIAVKPEDDAS